MPSSNSITGRSPIIRACLLNYAAPGYSVTTGPSGELSPAKLHTLILMAEERRGYAPRSTERKNRQLYYFRITWCLQIWFPCCTIWMLRSGIEAVKTARTRIICLLGSFIYRVSSIYKGSQNEKSTISRFSLLLFSPKVSWVKFERR